MILVLERDGRFLNGKWVEWPRLEEVEGGDLSSPRKKENVGLGMRCYVVPQEFAGLSLDSLVQAAVAGALHEVQLKHKRSVG